MSAGRTELVYAAGFGLITLAFAVTQPFVLLGLPLALFLLAWGPRNAWTAAVVGGVLALSFLGERTGIWLFERGWSLLVAGMYLWASSWRPSWPFSARVLAALGMAAAAAAAICLANPMVWLELDAAMAERITQASRALMMLLGDRVDETVRSVMRTVVRFQLAVFPAMLGVSSLAALGAAVSLRNWIAGEAGRSFGSLRNFRFHDQLIWLWLLGLVLLLAPLGEIAGRVGSNAVFFMGALYVVRGLAVVLSLVGGISIFAGVVGGVVALLITPILALAISVMLVIGLGDTWLDLRERVGAKEGKQ